jgi:hypothetical protein
MAPRNRLTYGAGGTVLTPASRKRIRNQEQHEHDSGDAQERRRLHHQLIADALAALETPEGLRAFVEVRGRIGQRYSWKNTALVAYQCPEASWLQGFHGWRKHGYSVKGARGIRITKPGGSPCTVFDVRQTDAPADELPPEGLEDRPEWRARLQAITSRGETSAEIAAAIACVSHGVDPGPLPEAYVLREVEAAHDLAERFEQALCTATEDRGR